MKDYIDLFAFMYIYEEYFKILKLKRGLDSFFMINRKITKPSTFLKQFLQNYSIHYKYRHIINDIIKLRIFFHYDKAKELNILFWKLSALKKKAILYLIESIFTTSKRPQTMYLTGCNWSLSKGKEVRCAWFEWACPWCSRHSACRWQ